MYNIKMFSKARGKVITLFDDYTVNVSKIKYEARYGQGLKILTRKQKLQRLPKVTHLKTY